MKSGEVQQYAIHAEVLAPDSEVGEPESLKGTMSCEQGVRNGSQRMDADLV